MKHTKHLLLSLLILLSGCTFIIEEEQVPMDRDDFPGTMITDGYIEFRQEDDDEMSAYFVDLKNQPWVGDNNEGHVQLDIDDLEIDIELVVGVTSCTGAIDGHRIEYEVDLRTDRIDDKEIHLFKGCNNDESYPFEVSNDELLAFAHDLYHTMMRQP